MRAIITHFKNLPEWAFLCLYLGFVFVYGILLGLQGFDMCDEGFCLTAYQQLFEHPLSAEYQFLYYNAVLVGALWNSIFGSWGILGFRVLSVIVRTLTAFAVYQMLKQYVNRWCVFVGIMLVVLNFNSTIVFHHNELTAQATVIIVWLMQLALTKQKTKIMLIAGIVMALNVFVRLTNVSMLALVLLLVPFYLYTKDTRLTLRMLYCAIGGFLIGLVLQVGVMIVLGHWDIFVNSVFTAGMGQIAADDSSHNLLSLLNVYEWNYMYILKCSAVLLFMPAVLWCIPNLNPSKVLYKTSFCLITFFYIILLWSLEMPCTFWLYTLAYTILFTYLLKYYSLENTVYLISASIIMLFFLPFGSDYGILNMGPHCMWIGLPFALGLGYGEYKKNRSSYRSVLLLVSALICISLIASKSLYDTSLNAYFDSGSRLKKHYKIDHPLANTYTKESRSIAVNELLSQLSNYVKPGDCMLAWHSLPMLHYLTHTYPYLNCSWIMSYDSATLRQKIEEVEKTDICPPPIIRQKTIIVERWDKYDKKWQSFMNDEIDAYISKHNYKVVWENELWQILLTDNLIKAEK